jgi:hypothetical protein
MMHEPLRGVNMHILNPHKAWAVPTHEDACKAIYLVKYNDPRKKLKILRRKEEKGW